MATTEFGSIRGTRLRITKEDSCGLPVIGAKSTLVTDGFIKVENAFEYDDGEQIRVRNAAGAWCIKEDDDPVLDHIQPTIDFCKVNPDTADMVLGARVLVDGADGKGYALGETANTDRFALELWTKIPGTGGCAGGTPLYGYLLIPNLGRGKHGPVTIANEAATFQMVGTSKASAVEWGDPVDGPYAVSHLPLGETLFVGEHIYIGVTETAPPAVTAGAVALAAIP